MYRLAEFKVFVSTDVCFTSFKLLHRKNSIAKRTIFWSSEPENIAIRPMLRYGPQNYTSIGETAIQVRSYDNTMYSYRKQNIMPSLSLLWIFACDKTIRDTQKWSFKERKNAPNKSTNASTKYLKKMTLLSHLEVRVACTERLYIGIFGILHNDNCKKS